jgi:hypothetical protein
VLPDGRDGVGKSFAIPAFPRWPGPGPTRSVPSSSHHLRSNSRKQNVRLRPSRLLRTALAAMMTHPHPPDVCAAPRGGGITCASIGLDQAQTGPAVAAGYRTRWDELEGDWLALGEEQTSDGTPSVIFRFQQAWSGMGSNVSGGKADSLHRVKCEHFIPVLHCSATGARPAEARTSSWWNHHMLGGRSRGAPGPGQLAGGRLVCCRPTTTGWCWTRRYPPGGSVRGQPTPGASQLSSGGIRRLPQTGSSAKRAWDW